jgi:hypothetical protein
MGSYITFQADNIHVNISLKEKIMDDFFQTGWTSGDVVCKNCKHIIPHVSEYIDGAWVYNAKCAKGKRSTDGKLFTIPDRNTYTCPDFEQSLEVYDRG